MNPKAPFLALLSVVVLVSCSPVGKQVGPTEAQVKGWIQQELAIGSDKQDVVMFLQRHRINYSEVDSQIIAGVGSTKSFLTRSDIQIEFRFDSEGKLASYVVKEVFTGP